jgi:hypothetical protein
MFFSLEHAQQMPRRRDICYYFHSYVRNQYAGRGRIFFKKLRLLSGFCLGVQSPSWRMLRINQAQTTPLSHPFGAQLAGNATQRYKTRENAPK